MRFPWRGRAGALAGGQRVVGSSGEDQERRRTGDTKVHGLTCAESWPTLDLHRGCAFRLSKASVSDSCGSSGRASTGETWLVVSCVREAVQKG